jgi:hypothetical protein
MSDDIQDDIDSAAEWTQQELEQQQRYRDELIRLCKREPMDPALFTTPLPPVRRWPDQAQFDAEMAQWKVLNYALDKLFPK